VGKLEGSNGPRRVVQSLWSGAAAAVHRLACPRPVSGPVATIVSPSPVWSACTPSSSRCGDLRQEVSQSHRLVAMWTWSSGTYTPTKGSTIATSLLSQEARLTCWTLVDDVGAWDTAWEWPQGGRWMPLAPGCLTTRVVAKTTPTVRNKADSTPLAHAGHRLAVIVTQRGARHSRSLCADAVPACV
jgi:hypothetical protein